MDEARHLVVFDCNVYLDVAKLVGPPFDWARLQLLTAEAAKEPLPHPKPVVDSLRAIAVCMSGRFAGPQRLEVWTNSHIDAIVRGKAEEADVLAWSEPEANHLVDELVWGIVARSAGGTLGDTFPSGNPPLDHEDGMVFGACRVLAGEDPLANVYCVTRDRGFLEAYRDGKLGSHTKVMAPAKFVALVRAGRSAYGAKIMRPGGV